MKYRNSFSKTFNVDRKVLYMIVFLTVVSIFTLTIVYAALSTTLKITGNTEVVASSWNVHFNNINVNPASVKASTPPTIVDPKTINFSVGLEEPGDFYKFTVDIVNDGTIDAMIESIVKTPTLTETQAKYIKYEIEYTDGNSISSKQLVQKNTGKTISVLIAYRSDILTDDIPADGDVLNLAFTMNYVQADSSGVVIPEGGKLIELVSGNLDTIGSEVCIKNECFYIISSSSSSITMLAKYNLLIGNKYDDTNGLVPLENPTGIQDETAKGGFGGYSVDNPIIGTKPFSSTNYWSSTTNTYPAYVYDENSYLYEYVENYKTYLMSLGVTPNESRLITIEELEDLGCSSLSTSCSGAPEWVYSTTYWLGVANSSTNIWLVDSYGGFHRYSYTGNSYGVRPVITISKSEF